MSEPFLGEIRMVGFNFAPRGWTLCQGQVLSIAQNSAMFALLGTTFGGDGVNTFGMPDLQGRSPVGTGSGGGLTPVLLGDKAGDENVILTQPQMPAHVHTAVFTGQPGTVAGSAATTVTVPIGTTASTMVPPVANTPSYLTAATAKSGLTNVVITGLYSATAPTAPTATLGGITADTTLNNLAATSAGTVAVGSAGGTQPVPLRNPYLGVLFIIATEGLFPSRP